MDLLTSLLREVRSEGALFGRNIMNPPWAVRFEDQAPLTLLAMVRGDGWVIPDGGEPVALGARDVAILGRGLFSVADDPTAPPPPMYVMRGPHDCTTAVGDTIAEPNLGVRTCGDSLDAPTVLLTATYHVRGRVPERLLGALPSVLVVSDERRPSPIMDLTVTEISREDPGQQAILDRLLDLLLLSTLREWFSRPEAAPPKWYGAQSDPVVGRALRLLHDEPARPWTVQALAVEAGVSRATFARRFSDLVGEPPMSYLTTWRLTLAADLLQSSNATVESVARQVGYMNAFGLSVAFKRVYGMRPSEHRAAQALR